jgi:hypothetical protein
VDDKRAASGSSPSRANWISVILGLATVALAAASAAISAHVSAEFRSYLYALAAASGVVGLAQAGWSVWLDRRHERAIEELRAGQDYLAQPESYRVFDTLARHHAGLKKADERFGHQFAIGQSPTNPGWNVVRCKQCGWELDAPLADGREAALDHIAEAHTTVAKRRWLPLRR